MRVFERTRTANTDEVIEKVKAVSSKYEHVVIASITGACAFKAVAGITDKEVICVNVLRG
jgi:hypothetical protein